MTRMIGSPAEIPVPGAPYDQIVPDMFKDGDFYKTIIDKYYYSVGGELPLVAVKASEMENVAQATRNALVAVKENIGSGYADMTGLIHYFHLDDSGKFFPEYADFQVTEEKFHGVSMYVPQDPSKGSNAQFNEDIKSFEWYKATELSILYN